MERWAISEFSSYRWSFEAELISFSRMGIQNLGLWNQKIEDFASELVEDWLFETQMGVSSFSWIGGFTGSEGVSHKDAIQFARDNIKTAAKLGAPTVIVYPGSRNGHTHGHVQRLLKSALQELIPYAMDYGVRLALEPMNCDSARNWTIFRSFSDTLEFLEGFDPATVGLVLDLYHVGLEADVYESLERVAERVALVQLADRRVTQGQFDDLRVQLGNGDIQLERWIRDLEQFGYQGFYEIELMGPEFEHQAYDQTLLQSVEWLKERAQLFSPRQPASPQPKFL